MTASTHTNDPGSRRPKILPDRRVTPPEPKPADLTDVAIAVFGTDAAGKPHAARFGKADVGLATRAAGQMRYKVLPVATDGHRALAARLPAGRVYGTGAIFAPLVKATAFAELSACEGIVSPPATAAGKPGEAPPAVKEPPSAVGGAELDVVVFNLPTDFEMIRLQSLVLARDDDPGVEGWYEARIVEDRGEGLFVLAWHGFDDLPTIVRRRESLGLLPPGYAAAVA
jgi:hypothetical protein